MGVVSLTRPQLLVSISAHLPSAALVPVPMPPPASRSHPHSTRPGMPPEGAGQRPGNETMPRGIITAEGERDGK